MYNAYGTVSHHCPNLPVNGGEKNENCIRTRFYGDLFTRINMALGVNNKLKIHIHLLHLSGPQWLQDHVMWPSAEKVCEPLL